MHEGGELGYSLVHAFGAAFDNPDLIVACVIGVGESRPARWKAVGKSVNFLNPVRDGAVLPILHLTATKSPGQPLKGAPATRDLKALMPGPATTLFVEGDESPTLPYHAHHSGVSRLVLE